MKKTREKLASRYLGLLETGGKTGKRGGKKNDFFKKRPTQSLLSGREISQKTPPGRRSVPVAPGGCRKKQKKPGFPANFTGFFCSANVPKWVGFARAGVGVHLVFHLSRAVVLNFQDTPPHLSKRGKRGFAES